jgi:hypothetical protein
MEKMYQHRRFMLKKGAEQVKSTISFIKENGLEDLCKELEINPPSNPVFFPLIVSTSLEDDGVVDDVHKISLLELTMLLVGDSSLAQLEFDKINEIRLNNRNPKPHLDAYFREIQNSCEPLYAENKVDAEGLIEHIKNRTAWKKNYENMRCDNPEVFDYKLK